MWMIGCCAALFPYHRIEMATGTTVWFPGPRPNIKTVFPRYGDSHVQYQYGHTPETANNIYMEYIFIKKNKKSLNYMFKYDYLSPTSQSMWLLTLISPIIYYSETCLKRPLNFVISQDRRFFKAGRIKKQDFVKKVSGTCKWWNLCVLVSLPRFHFTGSTIGPTTVSAKKKHFAAEKYQIYQSYQQKKKAWITIIIKNSIIFRDE